jgi:ribosomal protein L5
MLLSSKFYQQQNKTNRCFFVKNIHQTPFNIEKLTLFYSLKKETSLKSLVRFSMLLEILSQQKAYFIRSKKSSVFLKIRKGAPTGVKVTLRKTKKSFFLETLIWKILSNIKTLEEDTKFQKTRNENLNSLMLVINDPLVFSELKDFYFFFKTCINLRILISFSQVLKKKETYFSGLYSQIPLK